ncbi:MAG: hypothetical protein SWQ30_18740 [Thermodesulfobacteriota bacterium]|nr:hypothetical protein [Thermodesulfobacteriota bacterium]
MGEKKENTWQRDLNWVPIGLEWILDEFERASQGKPTEDKDVIPHAPYIFKLGFVSPARPDTFMIGRYLILTGQRETFGPGNYCFEIKVVGENLEPITKYFYLEWLGQCPDKIEDVRRRLKVFARDDPPW